MKHVVAIVAGACALTFVAVPDAQAYIDPGTGSMLLQVLGASIAGAIFYFRELRIKILSLFSRRPAAPADEGEEKAPDDPPR